MHVPEIQARARLILHAATAYRLGHLHLTSPTHRKCLSIDSASHATELSMYLLKTLYHDAGGVVQSPQGMLTA